MNGKNEEKNTVNARNRVVLVLKEYAKEKKTIRKRNIIKDAVSEKNIRKFEKRINITYSSVLLDYDLLFLHFSGLYLTNKTVF